MPNPVPQDIAVGEFRDLFLRQLDAFIDACRDKSAGELFVKRSMLRSLGQYDSTKTPQPPPHQPDRGA